LFFILLREHPHCIHVHTHSLRQLADHRFVADIEVLFAAIRTFFSLAMPLTRSAASHNNTLRSASSKNGKKGNASSIIPSPLPTMNKTSRDMCSEESAKKKIMASRKRTRKREEQKQVKKINNNKKIKEAEAAAEEVGTESHQGENKRECLSSQPAFVTLGGWSLKEGLEHIQRADKGRLAHLVETHGAPKFYTEARERGHNHTFRSLCQIIAGQQLAGAAARKIWLRLLATVTGEKGVLEDSTLALKAETLEKFSAACVLAVAGKDDMTHFEAFRQSAGLSRAKAKSVLDLSRHFERGDLSDAILMGETGLLDGELEKALLKVKGLGPWSVHMFLMFKMHRPNVLPFGDFGVRKGIQLLWNVKGSGKKDALHDKKDKDLMLKLFQPFEPYRSLASYYMWKRADTKDFHNERND